MGLDVGRFKDIEYTLKKMQDLAGFKTTPTMVERRALTSAFAERLSRGLE